MNELLPGFIAKCLRTGNGSLELCKSLLAVPPYIGYTCINPGGAEVALIAPPERVQVWQDILINQMETLLEASQQKVKEVESQNAILQKQNQ